jgi:multisubunit Na+/H+ antiporter MnhG subunit
MTPFKRIVAYILTGLVLIFALITLLGIWGFIDLEDLFIRMFKSIVVILGAAAIIVFIFAILIRDSGPKDQL